MNDGPLGRPEEFAQAEHRVASATMAAVRVDEITVVAANRGTQITVPLHPTLKSAIENRPKSI
jgi:hypothetical protein